MSPDTSLSHLPILLTFTKLRLLDNYRSATQRMFYTEYVYGISGAMRFLIDLLLVVTRLPFRRATLGRGVLKALSYAEGLAEQ